MRIGVICEGPSDFPAIANFVGHIVGAANPGLHFLALYPEMDKTRPEGGWANVLLWLKNNPYQTRVQRYFAGGFFGGSLSVEPLDAIILHLDADIVDDDGFRKFVKARYALDVTTDGEPTDRAMQVCQVLMMASEFSEMTDADQRRHLLAPAVEATETWCLAAFHAQSENFELLRGTDLINAFMSALERSEGRDPQQNYAKVDKSLSRRSRFCERHAAGASRIVASCEHFAALIQKLEDVKVGF